MKILNRHIGFDCEPLVIAEIGINHGGSLDVAKQMVLAAANAGAECIKHQTHFVEDEMTFEAKDIYPPNADRSIWDVINDCSLTQDEEVILKRYVESLGMIYISTPFSRKAADFLNEIGVPAFKIGSGEIDNIALVSHIASFGKPIIMSTGMQTIESIRPSVDILDRAGVDYALLECTNSYPSPPEIVSLKGILELRQAFPNALVGFSDHSIGPYISLAAAGLGACIIERHFTDSRYRVGPDIVCSMDPVELKVLVDRTREISIALNNPKIRTAPEEDVYRFARSSIVADRNLKRGQMVSEGDIWARRPGTGEIPGSEFYKIVGMVLKRDVDKNQQLNYSDFE